MRRTLYDEDHELFRDSLTTFVEREVAPHYERWERDGLVDKSMYLKAGEAGLLGLSLPEEHGGGGVQDFRFHALITEEFTRLGYPNAALGITNHNDVAVPYFQQLCTPEQQERWFPGLCSGELLAGVGMTEPGAGSDLVAISTHAVRDGDVYVLNGAKQFITNGINGELFVVVCTTGDSPTRHKNLSLLVVEGGMEGFVRGRNLDKIGQHSADTTELFFDDVRVPVANRLGEENQGFYYLMSKLPHERLSISVQSVSHAEMAFQLGLQYAKDRHAFGQPIGSFQHNRFTLATMRTELDIAWTYLDRQIVAYLEHDLTAEEAAEGKWWTSDLQRRVLDQCLQLHGGNGYMEEFPIARAWRDGRVMSIYGGTNEIMKDIIGRRMLGV